MDPNVEAGVDWALANEGPLDDEIARACEGAVFPLTREEVVELARENEAPGRLVTLLSGLPDRTFQSVKELQRVVAGV